MRASAWEGSVVCSPPLPSSANVFMTQIHAYLARARCQLVMHIPCTHLREIRRWEELVPVSFYPPPPLHPPLHLSCSSADVVGPLRAHLLCCRSFGPAGVWLGARWLGRHPRKSTQVSHGSIALTGPIKERQETDVRRKHIMQSPPSGAQTRRGFYTDIYKLMTWETLWRWKRLRSVGEQWVFSCKEDVLTLVRRENTGRKTKPPRPEGTHAALFWSVAAIRERLLKLLQSWDSSRQKKQTKWKPKTILMPSFTVLRCFTLTSFQLWLNRNISNRKNPIIHHQKR